MKRGLIGGFISLIGSIWALAAILFASGNLVSEWSTPPGRFLTTVFELGIMPWLIISLAFVFLGVALMIAEYFRRDN